MKSTSSFEPVESKSKINSTFPKLESGTTTFENVDLLAERRSRRQDDREKRRQEFKKNNSLTKKDSFVIVLDNDEDDNDDDTDEKGIVTMSPDQILKRSFETVTPPGIGLPHKSLSGVSSLERPFQRTILHQNKDDENDPENRETENTEPSTLPEWVRNHPDFKRCVAKPLDLYDSKHRAKQLRKALRLSPEDRSLSSVLLVAQWLVEFTDIDLEGVPRRNLMAMARAMYMRRLKRKGKAVYLAGETPTNVYIVMDGIAVQDSSLSQHAHEDPKGTILGSGRTFGLVSPLTVDEPRTDSVFNDVFPWDIEAMSMVTNEETFNTTVSAEKGKKPPQLLLAVIPLSAFFEEAAPGLSARAESYRPYVSEHLSPSRTWLDSKHFVFARQLRTRTFMPGDVVWRRGQPADTLAVVVDGNFVITREVTWRITNMWPESSEPSALRRCRAREDGTTMVLETISNVFGSGEHGATKKPPKIRRPLGVSEEDEIDPSVKVIVGEEPLLLVREDPNGIKHSFEETRRYTLRAAGPGMCILVELPRNAVRRYLPFRGSWAASIAKQATSRQISDEGVALAHRQRVAYESASRTEWGEKMLAREKKFTIQNNKSTEFQQGITTSDTENKKSRGHLLAHTGKILKDEWEERAKALRNIPRAQQGNWGKGLEVPLPMLVAGNPVIQRGWPS